MTPQELIEAVAAAERSERSEREKRGLPLDHVLDMAQFPFAFASDALAEYCKVTLENSTAPFFHATAHLARGDYQAANEAMELWQEFEPDEPRAVCRFGLKTQSSNVMLPAITGDYPRDSALFVCCDGNYFRKFGIVLLRSVADHNPGLRVHIHLMNPDLSLMRFVEPLPLIVSVSHEICPHNRKYYHAARLIRFSEALERCNGSLLMTDTDALVTGSISLSGPLALRVRPGRIFPWNQFSACYIRGDASSRPYFRYVSDIVKFSLSRLWWGLDQHALLSGWVGLRPIIDLVGPHVASVENKTPGLFWYTAGTAKEGLLNEATPYGRLFQDYYKRPA